MNSVQFAYYLTKAWIEDNWKKINEHTFNIIFLLLSIWFMVWSYAGVVESYRVLALILIKVAFYLNISDLYIRFLGSLGRDINSEVFDQNNTASAIYITGFRIALAIGLLSVI